MGASAVEEKNCPICFCEMDDEKYQLQSCGHEACLECLLQLATTAPMPLKCPVFGCDQVLVWRDITSLLGPKLADHTRKAYNVYRQGNLKILGNCFGLG